MMAEEFSFLLFQLKIHITKYAWIAHTVPPALRLQYLQLCDNKKKRKSIPDPPILQYVPEVTPSFITKDYHSRES